jgi:hypothetical protein
VRVGEIARERNYFNSTVLRAFQEQLLHHLCAQSGASASTHAARYTRLLATSRKTFLLTFLTDVVGSVLDVDETAKPELLDEQEFRSVVNTLGALDAITIMGLAHAVGDSEGADGTPHAIWEAFHDFVRRHAGN